MHTHQFLHALQRLISAFSLGLIAPSEKRLRVLPINLIHRTANVNREEGVIKTVVVRMIRIFSFVCCFLIHQLFTPSLSILGLSASFILCAKYFQIFGQVLSKCHRLVQIRIGENECKIKFPLNNFR